MDDPGDRLTADAEQADHTVVHDDTSLRAMLERQDPYRAPQVVVLGLVLDTVGLVLARAVNILGP